MALSPEDKESRESRLNSNAGKRIKNTASITNTKVNTQERQNEVEAWQEQRPRGGGRADYIAWAAENPNQRSNAARRLGKKAAVTRAAKKAASTNIPNTSGKAIAPTPKPVGSPRKKAVANKPAPKKK